MKNLSAIKPIHFSRFHSFALVVAAHALFLFVAAEGLQESVRMHHGSLHSTNIKVRFQAGSKAQQKREAKRKTPKIAARGYKAKTVVKKEQRAQESSPEIQAIKGSGAVDQGQNTALSLYTSKIKNILEKNKFYPVLAKRMGHTGLVEANFIIDKDGKVKKILTIQSKYKTLGKAVEDLLLHKVSFPPFPNELTQASMDIIVPINFEI